MYKVVCSGVIVHIVQLVTLTVEYHILKVGNISININTLANEHPKASKQVANIIDAQPVDHRVMFPKEPPNISVDVYMEVEEVCLIYHSHNSITLNLEQMPPHILHIEEK